MNEWEKNAHTWWMASSLQLKQLVRQFITCRTISMIADYAGACVAVFAVRCRDDTFLMNFTTWIYSKGAIPSNWTTTNRTKANLKINYRIQQTNNQKKTKKIHTMNYEHCIIKTFALLFIEWTFCRRVRVPFLLNFICISRTIITSSISRTI